MDLHAHSKRVSSKKKLTLNNKERSIELDRLPEVVPEEGLEGGEGDTI